MSVFLEVHDTCKEDGMCFHCVSGKSLGQYFILHNYICIQLYYTIVLLYIRIILSSSTVTTGTLVLLLFTRVEIHFPQNNAQSKAQTHHSILNLLYSSWGPTYGDVEKALCYWW